MTQIRITPGEVFRRTVRDADLWDADRERRKRLRRRRKKIKFDQEAYDAAVARNTAMGINPKAERARRKAIPGILRTHTANVLKMHSRVTPSLPKLKFMD